MPSHDARAVRVGKPDAEPQQAVTVMIGNVVLRLRGRAAAVAALVALNQAVANRPDEWTVLFFPCTPEGVKFKTQASHDYYSFEDPEASVERFKRRPR